MVMTMMVPRRQRRRRTALVSSVSSTSTSTSALKLFLIVLIAQSFERVQGSSNAVASTTSPIRNWDPSWAASCAQGTVVAVSYPIKDSTVASQDSDGHGVVLLMRSPTSTARKDPPTGTSISISRPNNDCSTAIDVDGLRVFPHSTNTMTAADSSRRWTPIGSTALCCMTGLASDVDYLSRTLQKQANVHRTIYEASHALATLKVVRNLADLLQEAVQWQGGRPFGVQALVVGMDRTVSNTATATTRLNLFSLDPSGGFRHWGSATAIGRGAQQVRKHLYESLISKKKQAPSNGKGALDEAMRACMTAMREASYNLDLDQYEALFVWTEADGQTMRVATIDPDQVQECQQMLQKELESPEKTAS